MYQKPSPEQLKNFRNGLIPTLGPYALMMPESQLLKIHEKMQQELNEPPPTREEVKKAFDSHKEAIRPGFRLGGLSNKIV